MKQFGNIDLGEVDEGLQKFTYNGKEVTVDILDIIDKIQEIKSELAMQNPSPPGAFTAKVKDLLEAEGLTGITKTATIKFLTIINALCIEIKKNIEQSVSLLQTTPESTSQT